MNSLTKVNAKMIFLLLLISSCLQSGFGQDQSQSSDKILIVYLTRTHNTKAVAEIIQQKTEGDLIALELVNPYPDDYDAIVKQVAEENESGFLPPLKTQVDLSKYDTVFLGFPTWGMQLPPPVKSFLHENNLAGKTVIPFNTHAGYGVGNGFKMIRELCPESKILEGFSIKGGSERDGIYLAITEDRKAEVSLQLTSWLRQLNILPHKR